jgi:hypothetical protein
MGRLEFSCSMRRNCPLLYHTVLFVKWAKEGEVRHNSLLYIIIIIIKCKKLVMQTFWSSVPAFLFCPAISNYFKLKLLPYCFEFSLKILLY